VPGGPEEGSDALTENVVKLIAVLAVGHEASENSRVLQVQQNHIVSMKAQSRDLMQHTDISAVEAGGFPPDHDHDTDLWSE
jgi:hypothetical protein